MYEAISSRKTSWELGLMFPNLSARTIGRYKEAYAAQHPLASSSAPSHKGQGHVKFVRDAVDPKSIVKLVTTGKPVNDAIVNNSLKAGGGGNGRTKQANAVEHTSYNGDDDSSPRSSSFQSRSPHSSTTSSPSSSPSSPSSSSSNGNRVHFTRSQAGKRRRTRGPTSSPSSSSPDTERGEEGTQGEAEREGCEEESCVTGEVVEMATREEGGEEEEEGKRKEEQQQQQQRDKKRNPTEFEQDSRTDARISISTASLPRTKTHTKASAKAATNKQSKSPSSTSPSSSSSHSASGPIQASVVRAEHKAAFTSASGMGTLSVSACTLPLSVPLSVPMPYECMPGAVQESMAYLQGE